LTPIPSTPGRTAPGIDTVALACVWLLMITSSVVTVEPAPVDIVFVVLCSLAFLCGMRLPKSTAPMIVLLAMWLLFSLVGTSQAPTVEYYKDTLKHMAITGLLIAVAVFFACFIYRFQGRAVTVIMNGWVIAALIAAATGILGYFDMLGSYSEQFVLHQRAKGPFKDPNVLAPFLIPPAIYCIYLAASRAALWSLFNLAILLVLVLALFLSFSRGGWGNFMLSGGAAVVLWFLTVEDRNFKLRLIVFMALAGGVLTLTLVSLLDVESIGELFLQRFAIQDYDSSAYGRFAGQYLTFMKALDFPFGLGAHGFLPDWYEQPHNVYLFQLIIGGWFGGLAYLLFVIVTLVKALAFLQRRTPHSQIMVVLFASFLGLAVEGLVVDSDHWRHFWILSGAIWGVMAMYGSGSRAAQPAHYGAQPSTPGPQPPQLT
jgi:O-antigen ligase